MATKLDRDNARHQTLAAWLPLDSEGEHHEVLESIRGAIAAHGAHRVILAPQVADSESVLDAIRLTVAAAVGLLVLSPLLVVIAVAIRLDSPAVPPDPCRP